jgi:hypothetical protein
MGDQFTSLEKLKDDIAKAINDKDPQMHKWAFYLFYWKFIPALCKRFKVAICCDEKDKDTETSKPTVRFGCAPGDWHPSKINEDTLKKLICCALEHLRKKKVGLQDATAGVETTRQNLDAIKKKIETDEKGLEDAIKSAL